MTYREKIKQEHPETLRRVYDGGVQGCPSDYGYEDENSCPKIYGSLNCTQCWNREIPEIGPKSVADIHRIIQFTYDPFALPVKDGENPAYVITQRVLAELVDLEDQAIVDAVKRTAREEGITTLHLLDRGWVMAAIREKLEREKQEDIEK